MYTQTKINRNVISCVGRIVVIGKELELGGQVQISAGVVAFTFHTCLWESMSSLYKIVEKSGIPSFAEADSFGWLL